MYFLIILINKTIAPVKGMFIINIRRPTVNIGEYKTPRMIKIKNKKPISHKN